jgi:hypothetical protein
MHVTDTLMQGTLGRYYAMRGRILQGVCSSPPAFPSTLPAPDLDDDTCSYLLRLGAKGKPGVEPQLYTCLDDVVQESIASFDRGYDYFLAVGDDLQLAKILHQIAQVYLDHLFAPVALLGFSYEERARLSSYQPSAMVSKAGSSPTRVASQLDDGAEEPEEEDEDDEEGRDIFISFDSIENPCEACMDICAETCNVMLMLNGYAATALPEC